MKTSELTGAALDWAVAKCEGYFEDTPHFKGGSITGTHFLAMRGEESHGVPWTHSSTDWAQGGSIIEREGIELCKQLALGTDRDWVAQLNWLDERHGEGFGNTPLVAAMRCYVASKLGDEVEIPEECTDEKVRGMYRLHYDKSVRGRSG